GDTYRRHPAGKRFRIELSIWTIFFDSDANQGEKYFTGTIFSTATRMVAIRTAGILPARDFGWNYPPDGVFSLRDAFFRQ
ncbi:MAG: hypothetical protein ACLFQ6_08570, partial [Candidatus Sumerlaeia bacterium]